MNIFVLRHAIAFEHGTPGFADNERPLTPEGKRKFRRSAEGIKSLKLSFDLILSSPLPRAKQTAEIFADILNAKEKISLHESLAPEGDAKKLITHLNKLRPAPESVVLVGHEPYLSELVSKLVYGNEILVMNFKKGGMCKLTTQSLKYARCATLEWLLTPKQMALMA